MKNGKLLSDVSEVKHIINASLLFAVHPPTEPSRRPKKYLVETLTLLTSMQTITTRGRKRTRMKKVGTDPRSRRRGGRGGRASLRSTSPVSWKVVT